MRSSYKKGTDTKKWIPLGLVLLNSATSTEAVSDGMNN